ncbi:hypothetical protein K2173_009180 [Erythroxylum novogranatense]|uniref:Phytochrome chromophore attachment site domain-containing protein n=1 Tax=Erythroxylum novogranatense TaxID=1862640 RepID=A0AAV8TF27_9ROSI|nr:hypothetical protein K2173_009180 [Erythroxylum novogranatense]
MDVKFRDDFEDPGSSFDYSSSSKSDKVTIAYLHHIQKDNETLKIIAYGENAFKMLTIFGEVALVNLILVNCKTFGKLFLNAIPYDVTMTTAGALHFYKLTDKSIIILQSLPRGSLERLCDTMVQKFSDLVGYDRVMAYKFHDDNHGEVISKITKSSLEFYLGLRYPVNDIPQATYDYFDGPIYTHTSKTKSLRGLIICYNTSSRFVSFLMRYAYEFLAQCLYMMDLVKYDGVALLYKNKISRLGITLIRDIAIWLFECHMDSTGISTNSLAGYPSARAIGNMVCGMKTGGTKHKPGEKNNIRKINVVKDIEIVHLNTKIIHSRLSGLKVEGMQQLEAGWNVKVVELTDIVIDNTIGKHLLGTKYQIELKTYGCKVDNGPINIVVNAHANNNLQENMVGMCFIDEFGWCFEWNLAMNKFTSWKREVINKMLLVGVLGPMACCHLKNQDAFINLGIVLNSHVCRMLAMHEKEEKEIGQRGCNHWGILLFAALKTKVIASTSFPAINRVDCCEKIKSILLYKRIGHTPLANIIFSRKMMEDMDKILDDSDIHNIVEDLHLPLIEFTYNNIHYASIEMTPYEALAKPIAFLSKSLLININNQVFLKKIDSIMTTF